MRNGRGFVTGAIVGVITLLCDVGTPQAADWIVGEGEGQTYSVSTDLASKQGVAVSIRYACAVGGGDQQLDILVPAEPFNTTFFGDESVGVLWRTAASPHEISSADGDAVFDQVKIDRTSAQGEQKIVLSFSSAGAAIMARAQRLSKAVRPLAIGLFTVGRKAPVVQSDILIEVAVPLSGTGEALNKAYARCGLAS